MESDLRGADSSPPPAYPTPLAITPALHGRRSFKQPRGGSWCHLPPLPRNMQPYTTGDNGTPETAPYSGKKGAMSHRPVLTGRVK